MTESSVLQPGYISVLSHTAQGFNTTVARVEKNVCELVIAIDGIGSAYFNRKGQVFCKEPIISAIYVDNIGSFSIPELLFALADLGPVHLGQNTLAFTAFPGKIVLVQTRVTFLNINVVNEVIIKARLQEYTEDVKKLKN